MFVATSKHHRRKSSMLCQARGRCSLVSLRRQFLSLGTTRARHNGHCLLSLSSISSTWYWIIQHTWILLLFLLFFFQQIFDYPKHCKIICFLKKLNIDSSNTASLNAVAQQHTIFHKISINSMKYKIQLSQTSSTPYPLDNQNRHNKA